MRETANDWISGKDYIYVGDTLVRLKKKTRPQSSTSRYDQDSIDFKLYNHLSSSHASPYSTAYSTSIPVRASHSNGFANSNGFSLEKKILKIEDQKGYADRPWTPNTEKGKKPKKLVWVYPKSQAQANKMKEDLKFFVKGLSPRSLRGDLYD